jgi:hypothetical protein
MNWFKKNPGWAFALRAALLFALFLSPLPWVADTYTTIYGTVANGFLILVDHDSRYGFRFEAPETIRAHGSWMGVLRVDDRGAQKTAHMKLDVRAFSYRPMATYLALALGARLKGRRKNAIVLGGGAALMAVVSGCVTVIAGLRFGIGKVLGFGDGPLNEAAYEALTTPAMTYVIPLVCFCVLVWLARESASPKSSPGSNDATALTAPP